MRLSKEQINTINESAHKVFGQPVDVYLFGSRVQDGKKGGDIDLLIDSATKELLTMENKINFLISLKKRLGDQKIDVVFNNSSKPIVHTAFETGIKL